MTNFLHSVFEENYNVDDREPVFEFHIPNVDGEFSVYAPKVEPWTQLLLSGFLQTLIQVTAAFFIYEGIVKRRGYIGSFIIGWFFVIPASLLLSFYLVDTFDMRNKVLCLGTSTATSVIFFRCIEAMYGTSPDVAELSISNYCSYYSSMASFVWNKKTKNIERLTTAQVLTLLMERLFQFGALSVTLSILIHYDYKPFEDKVGLTSLSITPDLLSFGHLCNSYLYTRKMMQSNDILQKCEPGKILTYPFIHCSHLLSVTRSSISGLVLFYFALNNLFELNAFQENSKGLKTERIFDSPLRLSKTPTEFWTKRWNRMVHKLLKGGVFEPAKLCFGNKAAAMFLTFFASGLYHEYCWAPIFYYPKYLYDENNTCAADGREDCYEYKFGRVTAFFAYTGMVMLLERPVRKLPAVQWIVSNLPTLVVSQLLVLIHVPVVKWYGGDWIEAGLFDDLSLMFFLIRKN